MIAWAVALAAGLGCHSASLRPGRTPTPDATTPAKLTAADGIKGDPGLTRTGFEAKARPEQELGVHMDMGRGHEAQGQLEAAAVDYQRALDSLEKPGRGRDGREQAQQKATAHRRLACVLDRLGRFAQSDVHYKAALRLAPTTRRSGTTPATASTSRAGGTRPSGACGPPRGSRRTTRRSPRTSAWPSRRGGSSTRR